MADPANPIVHLVPRKVPPFARLGPLSHLDLEFNGVGEVVGGDAKPARRNLFDGAALAVPVVLL